MPLVNAAPLAIDSSPTVPAVLSATNESPRIWGSWSSATTITIHSDSDVTSSCFDDVQWNHWIGQSVTASTMTSVINYANACLQQWVTWNSANGCTEIDARGRVHQRMPMQMPIMTAEQIAAAEVQRAQQLRIDRKARAHRRLAKIKAENLLLRHLTPDQAKDLKKWGFFKLYVNKDGEQKVYRIRRGSVQNIDLVRELPNGMVQPITTLCAHPYADVPDADTMLIQKLMLETNEKQFLGIANVMAPVPGALRAPLTQAA